MEGSGNERLQKKKEGRKSGHVMDEFCIEGEVYHSVYR